MALVDRGLVAATLRHKPAASSLELYVYRGFGITMLQYQHLVASTLPVQFIKFRILLFEPVMRNTLIYSCTQSMIIYCFFSARQSLLTALCHFHHHSPPAHSPLLASAGTPCRSQSSWDHKYTNPMLGLDRARMGCVARSPTM